MVGELFADLPTVQPCLTADEMRLLADLPLYDPDGVMAVAQEDEPIARRLERRGLVKIHRWKDDPISARRTLYAGKLANA